MINRIKAKPYGTAKQGRSQGKLWLILYVWGFILEHFFHINYFHWTLLHLKFDQRTHSLINIVFLTSCLTFLITSTDIEGRRIYLKNCDENCCRLLIRNDHGDSGGLVICLFSPRYERIIMEQLFLLFGIINHNNRISNHINNLIFFCDIDKCFH